MAAQFTPGLTEQLANPSLVAMLSVNVTLRAVEVCRIEKRNGEEAGREGDKLNVAAMCLSNRQERWF